jgi:hypothetical protein
LLRVHVLCYMAPMSDTAAAPPPAAIEPDPDRAVPARLDPASVGNILRLLRTLFAYGRNLVETLRREDDANDLPWYAFATRIFGTTNPALITVFVIRGLLRVAALQARLSNSFAPARALLPLPLREGAGGRGLGRGPVRGPAPRQRHAAIWAIPPGWPAGDQSFDRPPSPEEQMYAEIVAEDRDRPIGPILFDICRDLGIVPEQMDPATWDELRLAISLHGADPAPFETRAIDSADPADTPSSGDSHIPNPPTADHRPPAAGVVYPPWPAPHPHYPAPAGTGPP